MSGNIIEPWPAAWTRAVLPTAILSCLRSAPRHGYAIAQELGRRGFGVPRGGSLYPVLARLESDGAVEARWAQGTGGPGRKEYRLTEDGGKRLDREVTALRRLTAAVMDPAGARVAPELSGTAPDEGQGMR